MSLKRVMSSIFERKIDSYYLLLIKFAASETSKTVAHHVYLVDMLDWLVLRGSKAVLTFNAGPGQMMLNAVRFFRLLGNGFSPAPTEMREKAEALMGLYLLGERNLIRDRKKDRDKYKSEFDGFMRDERPFAIDVEKQSEFAIR